MSFGFVISVVQIIEEDLICSVISVHCKNVCGVSSAYVAASEGLYTVFQ